MNDDIRISEKVKSEIKHFAQIITQGMAKPKKKFIHQMLFGIQASRDIKLSNIARSLSEETKLIKTENRLSRNAQGERTGLRLNETEVSLVVVRGLGKEPMLLLTNVDKGPREILEIYLTRWKCEESYGYCL